MVGVGNMAPPPEAVNRRGEAWGDYVRGARVLIVGVSAATGACFAAVAGLSISAIAFPVRRFHAFSAVMAAAGVGLALTAFRAAIVGKTDQETAVASLHRGMLGALLALVAMVALLLMFKVDMQAFLAHAMGRRASTFTTYRLLAAAVLLGFGTGFVAGTRKPAA